MSSFNKLSRRRFFRDASLAALGATAAAQAQEKSSRRLIMGYCGTSLQAADMEAPIGVLGQVCRADKLAAPVVE